MSKRIAIMKKVALLSVPALAVASFAQQTGMPTFTDAAAAITDIGTTATSAFNTFSGTIVPLLLGGLVLVGGLTIGKWIIKKIRP